MVMRESTFRSVVSAFEVSICHFWWKGGKVNPTTQSLISILEKTLFVKDDYSAKEIHVAKMVRYFPEYDVKGLSDFAEVLEKYKQMYFESENKGAEGYYHWASFEDYLEKLWVKSQ